MRKKNEKECKKIEAEKPIYEREKALNSLQIRLKSCE